MLKQENLPVSRTRLYPDRHFQHVALLTDQSQTLCTTCFHQQERYGLRDPEHENRHFDIYLAPRGGAGGGGLLPYMGYI